MANNPAFDRFAAALANILPGDQIISDLQRRTALACDASFYSLTPRLVVYVHDLNAMQALLKLANAHQIAVTFRAAGTSLSGQAISDSVLVLLTRDWTDAEVLNEGRQIRLAPGVIGANANAILKPWGRKIGPDPASINTCKVGGIAANNASGMCCGVRHNSYHTLEAMTLVLADGTLLDTGDPASIDAFRQTHTKLLDGLTALANTIAAEPQLADHIAHQFRLKNTMGYGLNALTDFSDPIDMLSHLMIGSEGTLGFIGSITYRTIALPRARQTGLYLFPDSQSACNVIPLLRECGADAVELMDTRALRAVRPLLAPFYDKAVEDGEVALLIDVGDVDSVRLAARINTITTAFDALSAETRPLAMCTFTHETRVINALWDIRKGLFPAVGAIRETGTTVIIEDVAFDLEDLPAGLTALTALFNQFGYHDAIIFGHALDGNVHFVFSQGVSKQELARYNDFMQAVVHTVAGQYGGSLKAEHGTGRNMAPFLVQQWGAAGVSIMHRLKSLLDPTGILNPGVILNQAADAHLQHVKHLPAVDPIVDTCIECGFCEPACPSLHHTLSPRQRIALARRAVSLPEAQQREIAGASESLSIDSCAATGMCATRCPVGINTGQWILKLRAERAAQDNAAAGHHYARTIGMQRLSVRVSSQLSRIVGKDTAATVSKTLNRVTKGRFPYLIPTITAPPTLPEPTQSAPADALYMPACPNRLFGSDESKPSLTYVIQRLFRKAGLQLQIPEGYRDACCGQPFSSKGQQAAAASVQSELQRVVTAAGGSERCPLILDASACALAASQTTDINTMDISEYLLHLVVPRLKITPMTSPLMLHVSCSSSHLDEGKALRTLAGLCATEVIEAQDIACCGFAGDKGLTRPELNAAALANLAGQVPDGCHRGVSNSRTCELGLSHHSGIPYSHIAILLDEVSAPR